LDGKVVSSNCNAAGSSCTFPTREVLDSTDGRRDPASLLGARGAVSTARNAPAPAVDDRAVIADTIGRPTIGVAFGGGSARGIAHAGVIRWLEEHRIPIDVAAGTSMGGLVGGAFASGMDAKELAASSWRSTGIACSGRPRSSSRTSAARPTRAYPSRYRRVFR
jgi:hypothetical protein